MNFNLAIARAISLQPFFLPKRIIYLVRRAACLAYSKIWRNQWHCQPQITMIRLLQRPYIFVPAPAI